VGILDRLLSEIPHSYWSIDEYHGTEESLYVGTPPHLEIYNLKAGMIVPEDPNRNPSAQRNSSIPGGN